MSKIRVTAAAIVAALVLIGFNCSRKAAAYDLQFIDTMTAHHEGAVAVAQVAETKATHPELRDFARMIVETQMREIALLGGWRGQWFAKQPKAVNMKLAGMAQSMKGMDVGHLQMPAGVEFDLMFIEMMIPHHRGAVTLAKQALTKGQHEEVRQFAQQIAEIQQREIEMMQRWVEEWKTAK